MMKMLEKKMYGPADTSCIDISVILHSCDVRTQPRPSHSSGQEESIGEEWGMLWRAYLGCIDGLRNGQYSCGWRRKGRKVRMVGRWRCGTRRLWSLTDMMIVESRHQLIMLQSATLRSYQQNILVSDQMILSSLQDFVQLLNWSINHPSYLLKERVRNLSDLNQENELKLQIPFNLHILDTLKCSFKSILSINSRGEGQVE